jgi:hypothetical protein
MEADDIADAAANANANGNGANGNGVNANGNGNGGDVVKNAEDAAAVDNFLAQNVPPVNPPPPPPLQVQAPPPQALGQVQAPPVRPPQVQPTPAQASLGGQGQGNHGQGHFRAFAQGYGQQQPFGSFGQGYGAAHHPPGFGAGPAVHGAPQRFGAGVHGVPQGAGAPQGFGAGLAAQGAPQGYGAGLAALGALDIARLRDLAAVFQPQAATAAPPAMRPGSSFEASEIWRTMANNVPTCLPPGTTDYAFTANGQVVLVRKPAKDEPFLAESVEESRSRLMRLEAEFRGKANEPNFWTIRDGMQGMELAGGDSRFASGRCVLLRWGLRTLPGDRTRCWSSTTTRNWPPSSPRRATGAKVRDREQVRDQDQASAATGASLLRGEGLGAGARGRAHGATSGPAIGGKAGTQRAGYATRAVDSAITPRIAGCHAVLASEEEARLRYDSVILSFL